MTVPSLPALPSLDAQHEQLSGLGLAVPDLPPDLRGDLLVLHPRHTAAVVLAPLLRLGDRAGFVVEDLADLAEFAPAPGVEVPDADLYAVTSPERGDEFANRSPDEVDPQIRARGRDLMTVSEGLAWEAE